MEENKNTEDTTKTEDKSRLEEELAATVEVEALTQVAPQSLKNSRKRLFIFLGFGLVVMIVMGIFVSNYLKQQALQKEFEAYRDNFTLTLTTMNSEIDKNLEVTNKTQSTWHDAIFESDKDFNVAILAMYIELEGNGTMKKIKDGREKLDGKITDLQNPPVEFENLYLDLLDYYSVYTQINELAQNPTGNLKSFGDLTNNLEAEANKEYNRIKPRIPKEMKK
ncbi:hypothetical protein V7149_16010 [Bacillus sp. JJ1503]|uniref:hypothetical protein n=1 Tax=Bacillus sp. JJ1503 TaxID=3122956 RepID=UPI002FFF178D